MKHYGGLSWNAKIAGIRIESSLEAIIPVKLVITYPSKNMETSLCQRKEIHHQIMSLL